MTIGTTTLNVGAGGDKVVNDSLATVNGAAAPSGAVAQVVKQAYGSVSDATLVDETHGMPSLLLAAAAGSWPGYSGPSDTGQRTAFIDDDGALMTRSAVLTDEGTFRVNFANTSVAVSIGSVTISGDTVTGTGFLAADVHYGDYFKLVADGESAWLQIASINSDTQLTLRASYVGGSSGAASRTLMRPVTGSGGSIAVASGACTIGGGTTANAITRLTRNVDYGPLVYRARTTISQRIANQTWRIGLSESFTTADRYFARFKIDGTTATTVICETGRNPTTTPSAAETESTTITLPNGLTTATSIEYRVELLTERVVFFINGVQVAEHTRVIPAQHDDMEGSVTCINGGSSPASNTNAVVDYVTVKNHNKLEIGVMSDAEKLVASQPPVRTFSYSQAGVIAINTDLLTIDCTHLRSISLQIASLGTTGQITPQWSNDGATWVTAAFMSAAAGTNTQLFTLAGVFTAHVAARFLRFRLTSATTAGTTTLAVSGYEWPIGPVNGVTVTGSVTIGTNAALVAGTALIGDVGMQVRANATGAMTVAKIASAATTNATSVKASAARVFGYSLTNTTAAVKAFRFYNLSAAPTVGTNSPYWVVIIPANAAVTVSFPAGISHSTGLAYAITNAITDLDATAVAANDVIGAIFYA